MSRLVSTVSLVRSLVPSEPRLPDPDSPDDHDDSPSGNISPQERIKRVAARTMDLGRSFTSRPRSPTLTLHPESKRTLCPKREDRGKEAQVSRDRGQGDLSHQNCSFCSTRLIREWSLYRATAVRWITGHGSCNPTGSYCGCSE